MTDAEIASIMEKNRRNVRVAARYDELMREGQRGHYESLFRVVREEVERAQRAWAVGSTEASDLASSLPVSG